MHPEDQCARCGHSVEQHILHGRFGPDECEADDCDCRYFEPVLPAPHFYSADKGMVILMPDSEPIIEA